MASGRPARIVKSGLLLRCPRCGVGRLFRGVFSMIPQCGHCGLVFEREPGYFVGAIYISYAATVMIAIPGYFVLDFFAGFTLRQQLLLWTPFAVIFPLLFFRHSRSLWLALDHYFNPTKQLYGVQRK